MPPYNLNFTTFDKLRSEHAAWRLLRADHAPLIIDFLTQVFVQQNRRAASQSELSGLLDDYLYKLREIKGGTSFPKSGKAYLEDWAKADTAYLRKYYPKGADEADFDLSPSAEKALEWIKSLEQRQFIGTESRLQSLLDQLHNLVQLTETDPQVRIKELKEQQQQIDVEIALLEDQETLNYDATQVKERFYQLEDTAQNLLGDFRQIEQNFRELDAQIREKITLSDQGKGAVLSEIFGDQDSIDESDQGKSFRAFWALIMSPQRQMQMSHWLQAVYKLEPVIQLQDTRQSDVLLKQIPHRLLEAGEKVQRTSALLTEQLRRYLDDQVWRENKRILQLMGEIERHAVRIKNNIPKEKEFSQLDETRAHIQLPMSRSLFRPDQQQKVHLQMAEDGSQVISSESLFQQEYVDIRRLQSNIRKVLQQHEQISLATLCELHPIQQGLSEVLAYMNLASQDEHADIDDQQQELIRWRTRGSETEKVIRKQLTLPRVLFCR